MITKGIWDVIGAAVNGFGVLVGLFALAVGLFALWVVWHWAPKIWRRYLESRHIVDDWPRTRATVTGVRVRTLGFEFDVIDLLQAEYTFTDQNGQERTGVDEASAIKEPVPGMICEVAYDPDDPTASHVTLGITWRIVSWAIAAVLVLTALIGLGAVLIHMGIDTLRDI